MFRESMDILQGDSRQSPLSPWTFSILSWLPGQSPEYQLTLSRLSTKSMDIVQRDSRQSPLSPWTFSILSWLPGQSPEYQLTLSRLSTKSMDIVQRDLWTTSTESMDIAQSNWASWTLSRVSMDQGAHGFSGHFTDDGPGQPYPFLPLQYPMLPYSHPIPPHPTQSLHIKRQFYSIFLQNSLNLGDQNVHYQYHSIDSLYPI